jgi:oligopeptide transport system ATP-binding protein
MIFRNSCQNISPSGLPLSLFVMEYNTRVMTIKNEPLLSVNNLTVAFPTEDGPAYAVKDLCFDIGPKEVLGLVGESGCGKSMTSLAVLGLVPKPGRIAGGEIRFNGRDLTKLSEEELRAIRGAQIALIPQDPLTSLNPVYTIGNQLCEVITLHQGVSNADAEKRAIELLELVRLPNARDRIHDYPHQFSGGMRQRVMIAMALSCNPELLIADEPTTALDVTVQAQILTLMQEIQRERDTAIILITHDLGVVAEMCHNVAVMYAGRIVEKAPVKTLFKNPLHPYTQGLLKSLPKVDRSRLDPIEGQPPALTEIPIGCSFEPRCSARLNVCTTAFPAQTDHPESQEVRCYLYEKN